MLDCTQEKEMRKYINAFKNSWKKKTKMAKLKGHSQLARMPIRYYFMANLHITKTRSIGVLTKYEKNNIIG